MTAGRRPPSWVPCRHLRPWTTVLAVVLLARPTLAADSMPPSPLVFGGDAAYPPFESLEHGTPRGFDIDLEDAIAAAGGARAEHRLGNWPDAIRALQSGAVDVLALFESPERAQTMAFTPPFYFVNHGIYARRDFGNVTDIGELRGRKVAVEELSYAHQRIEAQSLPFELVLTSNTLTALEAVRDHRADFAILAAPTSNRLIRDRKLPLRDVGPPVWPRGYVFAVRKDRAELAAWLTQQFFTVLRDGTYQDVYARWQTELGPAEQSTASHWLAFAAVPLGVLLALGLAWAWKLRRALVAGTRRLVEEARRRTAAESQARWVADHDVYTDMPRLHHFSAEVGGLLARLAPSTGPEKQIVALKLVDIDRTIRTLGHEAGIAAMRAFGQMLRSMDFDACCQTGRDVYLVFGDRQQIQQKLFGVVSPSDTVILDGAQIPRMYAGIATWPKHGSTLPELLRRAETALAVASQRHETWVEYQRSMEPDETDLKLLELFRGTSAAGIYPAFQPQVDIRSGAVVGAEALARWDPPGIGPVGPDRFIPLLEDAGLVRHVTARMLREAVRVSAELRRLGAPCPIGVNVTASDLLSHKTPKAIFKVLRAHDGLPGDLKLELTETGVAERPDTIRWMIARLREAGVYTSIDDFGTGYSSLAYLSDFPIQELKIDRSFVAGMLTRAQDRSIVRSTIAMAHELGLLVVAEGVETRHQLDMLRADGCDRAQGYLIARPLPEREFVEFVRVGAHIDLPATLARGA
ncbi:MAG TPA: EAL domain-containing protein [Gammaproteobacteria bacterium]|nr:EAL domain-containing protein [Gammaproteobacteria bacterium]